MPLQLLLSHGEGNKAAIQEARASIHGTIPSRIYDPLLAAHETRVNEELDEMPNEMSRMKSRRVTGIDFFLFR